MKEMSGKTAFNTHLGHFEYFVDAVLINQCGSRVPALGKLWDFINPFVFVYLDDALIFSRSVSERQTGTPTIT